MHTIREKDFVGCNWHSDDARKFKLSEQKKLGATSYGRRVPLVGFKKKMTPIISLL